MRIRKNAKLSPLLFTSHASAPEDLLPHVCKLNQSPWDVIPFAHHDSSHYQFEAEDSSFNGNGSYGDSIGAVESVASMMDTGEDKPVATAAMPNTRCDIEHNDNIEKGIVSSKGLGDNEEARRSRDDNDNGIGFSKKQKISMFCQKNDGKGWHCKKEAKQGHSFCEHHLSLLRSYNNNNTSNHNATSNNVVSKKAPAVAAAIPAVGSRRVRAKAKKGGSSNPYEFYYYSGFGPLWGRKRGGEKDKSEAKSAENDTTTHETPPLSQSPSSSSQIVIDNEEFDYVDYDDEDDDDNGSGDSRRKRMRKPVKARSLKSLM